MFVPLATTAVAGNTSTNTSDIVTFGTLLFAAQVNNFFNDIPILFMFVSDALCSPAGSECWTYRAEKGGPGLS
jgi:hypothetical protein